MAACDHQETAEKANSKRLMWALAVIVFFMFVEVVGGVLSGSLALLADATHMLTDAFALALAASAQIFARRPADAKLHFGYRRAQVLAAFVNGLLMAFLLVWILSEAVHRFFNPVDIDAPLMLAVACIGLGANIIAFFVLHGQHTNDLNMRGALLHVVGDLLGSLVAIAAAIAIMMGGGRQIDPILSIVVACLIGVSAFRLIRDSGYILLEGSPEDIDVNELAKGLKNASPLIRDVHHVQIWQITPGHPRLTLHACVENAADAADALASAKAYLEAEYKIRQSTIQVEVGTVCPDHYTNDAHVRTVSTVRSAAAPAEKESAEPASAYASQTR